MLGDTMRSQLADIFSMLKRLVADYKVGQYMGFTTMADSLYAPEWSRETFCTYFPDC